MRRISFVLACLSLSSTGVFAQGTAADYARAETLAPRVRGTIVDAVNQTNWIGRTNWVWYRKTTPTGTAFVLVDADLQQKAAAFDQPRLARALTAALKRPVS